MKASILCAAALAFPVLAALSAVAAEAPAPGPPGPTGEPPRAASEPKLVLMQWQSLYLARKKVGYVARSLYEFPDRGRRLETNLFLARPGRADQFGYYKMITADVDERFRPRALDCRVASGDRSWQTTGRPENGELVLVRTVGGKSATARIPLDDDVTFHCWTLPATLLSAAAGETKRWTAVDESLGAMLPDPCFVQVLGPRSLAAESGGPPVSGTGVVWACGPEQVAHLAAADGRILRSIWQSAPLVAQATGMTEARRLRDAADGPSGPAIEGLSGQRYTDPRRGLSLRVPPYPFVAHISPATGMAAVVDMTEEASVSAQVALLPQPAAGAPQADPPAGRSPTAGEGASRMADLIQRGWAARFEDVQAAPAADEKVGGRPARSVEGTLRLGCTTFFFRNYFLASDGRGCFISVLAADGSVSAHQVLASEVVQSVALSPPEGPLPLQGGGDVLRSPYHGFELRRPGPRWVTAQHVDGPPAVLELARQDHAAVAVIRLLTPRPEQSLEGFVKDQAQLVADNLGTGRPEPRPATLGGRAGYELAYEARGVLGQRAGRCAVIYTKHGDRVFCLALVAAADADPSAAQELQALREGLKFSEQPPSK